MTNPTHAPPQPATKRPVVVPQGALLAFQLRQPFTVSHHRASLRGRELTARQEGSRA